MNYIFPKDDYFIKEDIASTLKNINSNIEKYMNVIDDGGVKKRIMKQGVGQVVSPGATVEVHYSAYHCESIVPFDSTRLRRRLFSIDVPESIDEIRHTAMSGIEIGVTSMKLFEEAFLILQPAYAMGVQGCSPRVPPNAICFVTVAVVSVVNFTHAIDYENLPMSEKKYAEFEVFESAMLRRKHQAKQAFDTKYYVKAVQIYKKTLSHIESYSAKNEFYDICRNKLLIDVKNNLALCNLLMNNLSKTLQLASDVLKIDEHNAKALFYTAKANRLNGNLLNAENALKLAKKYAHSNSSICEEFSELERDLKLLEKNNKMIWKFPHTREEKDGCDQIKNDVNNRPSITKSVADLIEGTIRRFIGDAHMKAFAFTSEYFNSNELLFLRQHAIENGLATSQTVDKRDTTILHISK